MEELTPRQRQMLDAIRGFAAEKGYPPSIRELGKIVGIGSLRGVTIHLDALERKGWIERERTSRSIRVIPPPRSIHVPLLDKLAAPQDDDLLAVRVSGSDMANEHIVEGDTIIVKRGEDTQPGDLVACAVGSTVIVVRLGRHGDADVLGRVIGLVREY